MTTASRHKQLDESIIKDGIRRRLSPERVRVNLIASGAPDVCERTVRRHMERLSGTVQAERKAKRKGSPTPQPEHGLPEAEEVPSDAGIAQLNYWLGVAERNAKEAETEGDLETLTKMVRLASTILDMRRKMMPPPKQDPNERPDMIAAAERARVWLHKQIDTAP